MVVSKTFNECCYILTNFSDSNNPIFISQEEVDNFKKRIQEKLEGLVEILAWSFQTDHYQLIVYLKSRDAFEEFYREKHKNQDILSVDIPETYLILSQEMANVLSGYAKWFNFRHERFGSLFGRRYTKILLETEDDVKMAIQEMNAGKKIWDFQKLWSYIWNFMKRMEKDFQVLDTSAKLYKEGVEGLCGWFSGFVRYDNWDLRGRYNPVTYVEHFD